MEHHKSSGESLWLGVGQADITPAMGIQIAGDIGRYRPVEQIRDPLFVRVFVLQEGGEKVCLVGADLCSVEGLWVDKLRPKVAELLDLDPLAVILHPTQSHSTPALGDMFTDAVTELPLMKRCPWLAGGDARYNEFFVERLLDAARQAGASMQRVSLRAVRGIDGRSAFNRRYIARDGSGMFQPARCDPRILRPEGPADPEVGLAVFDNADGQPVAALLHHTCHPCHGYPQRWISADWPGFWARGAASLLGGDCVTMVLNGFCGNVLHGNALDPDQRSNIYLMGERLMETTRRILPDLAPLVTTPLRRETRRLRLPRFAVPEAKIAASRKLLAENPDGIWQDEAKTSVHWDWMYAMALVDHVAKCKQQTGYDCELQVVRIGELAVVAWPGEPFVEAQLDLKLCSPAKQVFAAHLCYDFGGYIPTRPAFGYGGYETDWPHLQPGALEAMTEETKTMLAELFQGGER